MSAKVVKVMLLLVVIFFGKFFKQDTKHLLHASITFYYKSTSVLS